MPRRRIEFDNLDRDERQASVAVAFDLYCRMPIERVEEIFRTLARYDPLVLLSGSETQQHQLGFGASSLLRNERVCALSAALALSIELGAASAEKVITHLAGDGAVVMAVARRGTQLIYEDEGHVDDEAVAQERRSAMCLVSS